MLAVADRLTDTDPPPALGGEQAEWWWALCIRSVWSGDYEAKRSIRPPQFFNVARARKGDVNFAGLWYLEDTVHLAKPTLLLVDDDRLILETLRRLLAHFGFNVVAHHDSVLALADLQQRNDIAIVVCDYEMPEINGEELARAAKNKNPQMPVFVLSGNYPPNVDVSPWDAWFLKGAPITELIRKLNAVLPLAMAAVKEAVPNGPGGEGRYDDPVSIS